jgi:hypothetical protein
MTLVGNRSRPRIAWLAPFTYTYNKARTSVFPEPWRYFRKIDCCDKYSYSEYLSNELRKALHGILINIDGGDILFYCPEGQFLPWKGNAGQT